MLVLMLMLTLMLVLMLMLTLIRLIGFSADQDSANRTKVYRSL